MVGAAWLSALQGLPPYAWPRLWRLAWLLGVTMIVVVLGWWVGVQPLQERLEQAQQAYSQLQQQYQQTLQTVQRLPTLQQQHQDWRVLQETTPVLQLGTRNLQEEVQRLLPLSQVRVEQLKPMTERGKGGAPTSTVSKLQLKVVGSFAGVVHWMQLLQAAPVPVQGMQWRLTALAGKQASLLQWQGQVQMAQAAASKAVSTAAPDASGLAMATWRVAAQVQPFLQAEGVASGTVLGMAPNGLGKAGAYVGWIAQGQRRMGVLQREGGWFTVRAGDMLEQGERVQQLDERHVVLQYGAPSVGGASAVMPQRQVQLLLQEGQRR